MRDIINLQHYDSCGLERVKLKKDILGYYLDLEYTIESDRDIRKLHILKARLPILLHRLDISSSHPYGPFTQVDIGFGPLTLEDVDGVKYTEMIIEEKVKEMTLTEIEKKLGHKVKIVNE